ncbi:MAG: hypothetical protein Q9201_001351 [Fulgogasparrea decipioides]
MSTPSWLNDVHALPNENGSFHPSTDPNAFMQMASAGAPFDYNVMQNQQYQQRIQNGNDPRNGSPAFQNSMYQTQPIVPTKRPRHREDSIGASPRQAAGMLPPSRSQTPQQGPYTGFQGAVNGGQNFPPPGPYHRFSNAGSNASLSPSMQNQQFNAQAPPRVQTVSPSPFSPAAQNFGSQASPPPQSEHGSRVNTPHNGATNYMQGMPYGAATNQSFTPPPNPNSVASQPPQNVQQQQRVNEMRQRQQYFQHMQANNATMQNRYPGMATNAAINPSNMTAMGGRMQQPQQSNMRPNSHENFVRAVAQVMQMRGLPFNPHPTVVGRPVHLAQLFSVVMKFGGSKVVTARSQWPTVAQQLQVAPAQLMLAASELQNYWQTNIIPYESFHMQNLQQRQRASMQEQMRMQRPPPNGEIPTAQDPYSPLKKMNAPPQDSAQSHAGPSQAPNQNGYLTPSKRIDHQQPDVRAAQLNGYLTPHHGSMDARHSSIASRQPQVSDQSYISPAQPDRLQIQATKIAKKTKPKDQGENGYPRRAEFRHERYSPTLDCFEDKPTLHLHGGLHIGAAKSLGDEVASLRPSVPLLNDIGLSVAGLRPTLPVLNELGVIDIRALTLSLRSGIKGEVRLALETLRELSLRMDLELSKCDDLVDALIECAEEQVEFLAEHAAEVSDAMLINSYEEMLRGGKAETEMFQLPPEYGSLEHDLERAVDRLIYITTTLRNFSSSELNCEQLANPTVITLLANIMRYLGTRNMLLRSHQQTLDLAKDIVVYLSNVSQHIDLPGREEASCVLHFLLAFAPGPAPTNVGDDDVTFSSYEPSLHCYLPHAIDSFAKLLAKDEPNRGLFRSVFYTDGASSPPFELLTKAFGFVISVLPKYEVDEQRREQLKNVIHARGPYVAQGLLAAEIIVGLIPASEHSLARAWLSSQDGFAASLTKMVLFFGTLPPLQQNPRQPLNTRAQEAEQIYAIIAYRGIAVLRKLAERVKDTETDATGLPWGVLPGKESLLINLMKPHIESSLLRQIFLYATLDL